MFNSDIEVESYPGKGSCFQFDIKFRYSIQHPEKNQEQPPRNAGLKGLKVLVAEDNKVNVLVIKKILSQWNIEPVVVENGALAVKKLEEEDFDIILMDLHMPEMDGYQATKQIRLLDEKSKAHIPIIALTASVSNAVDTKVAEAGMNGYIPKPFDPNQLYEKLILLLSR